jgi:protein-L-isoaspartate(D-aspartate) O-methyltransferase
MVEIDDQEFADQRAAMVELISAYVRLSADQIDRSHLDERVMASMSQVPRHVFVPAELQQIAYADSPLPIGHGKTISQPFIVALMADLLAVQEDDRVLEVGTGLGYQAAVLAELAGRVYSVEIIEELGSEGRRRLTAAGYDNIEFRIGDGGQGWPDHAPYDKVIVTAATELIPPPLLQQLKPGGRMVIPCGLAEQQQLTLVEKDLDGRVETKEALAVLFAPLIVAH